MSTAPRGRAPQHLYTPAERKKHALQRRHRRNAKHLLAAVLLLGVAAGLIFGIPALLGGAAPAAGSAASAGPSSAPQASSPENGSASSAAASAPADSTAAPAPSDAPAMNFTWDTAGVDGCDYLLAVNFAGETVTVYTKDADGNYTVPYKAMICSGGEATPLGEFRTIEKYRWRALQGDVYGQYATRITGHILFHSVPYFSQNVNDLEYEEFNKLGTDASLGCIRVQVADAKWIYDNCPVGTPTVIYNDAENPGPLGQPTFTQIDVTNETLRGWDPTDPDEANPWKTAQ